MSRNWIVASLALSAVACSPASNFTDDRNVSDGPTNGDAVSMDTYHSVCTGTPSSLTGRTYAPNGMDPIPNVTPTLVPDGQTFPAPPTTVQCLTCSTQAIPSAIASVQSGPDGTFNITGSAVDMGGTFTVVFEIGGFRHVQRHVQIGMCSQVNMPSNETSLPGANSGDDAIPRILVAGYRTTSTHDVNDHFTRVLDAIGITGYDTVDPDKTGTNGGTGRDLLSVLNDMTQLQQYQVVVTPCGSLGNFAVAANVTTTIVNNLHTWLGMGGRLYASDLAYSIIDRGYAGSINFATGPSSHVGADPADVGVGMMTGAAPLQANVDDPQLRSWLQNVGVLTGGAATIPITDLKDPWGAIDRVPDAELMGTSGPSGVVLVSGDVMWHTAGSGHHPLTVLVDYAAPGQGTCGRVVFTSYHVQSTSMGPQLTPQERVLEFLFFRLSTCIQTPG
jgi:hypothetical protein